LRFFTSVSNEVGLISLHLRIFFLLFRALMFVNERVPCMFLVTFESFHEFHIQRCHSVRVIVFCNVVHTSRPSSDYYTLGKSLADCSAITWMQRELR
jgi:hypothetical protein